MSAPHATNRYSRAMKCKRRWQRSQICANVDAAVNALLRMFSLATIRSSTGCSASRAASLSTYGAVSASCGERLGKRASKRMVRSRSVAPKRTLIAGANRRRSAQSAKARKRSRLAHRVARVATIGMSCGAAADCRIARRRERLLRLDRARALDVLDVLRTPRSSVKKKEMASRGYHARPAAVTERRGRRGDAKVSHAAHRRSRCFGYSSSTPLSSGIRNSVATMSSTYSAASSAIAT